MSQNGIYVGIGSRSLRETAMNGDGVLEVSIMGGTAILEAYVASTR